jgi:predicted nucleic acid-binding protein
MREKTALGGSDRDTVCRAIIDEAKKGKVEILTSTLSFVEVCKKSDVRTVGEDKIGAFFENDFILPMNLDRIVGEHARLLMTSGYTGLKPLDAVHLASAVLGQATEMHTFDDKLLKLNGYVDRVDGGKLKICLPDFGDKLPPLLSQMGKP